jgi:superfamily I DNA/RNA helicase
MTFIDLILYISIAEDFLMKRYLILKDCMIDYALENSIVKRSDTRLSDDDFTYKDWSLQVYSKARNLRVNPTEAYKSESYKKDNIDVFLRKIQTYESYKAHGKQKPFIDFDDMIQRAVKEVTFPSLEILILDEAQIVHHYSGM